MAIPGSIPLDSSMDMDSLTHGRDKVVTLVGKSLATRSCSVRMGALGKPTSPLGVWSGSSSTDNDDDIEQQSAYLHTTEKYVSEGTSHVPTRSNHVDAWLDPGSGPVMLPLTCSN